MPPAHSTMVRHMKRLIEHVDTGAASLADGVMRLPVALYTDAEYWQREVKELFHRRPIVLALSCDLPGPNSYVALDDVPGFRILVTRDKDGRVRAFFNSCTHRGTPVAAGRGTTLRFTCPYHGWTYNSSGNLVGISSEKSFGLAPCEEMGLKELPTEERCGLVFGVLDPSAALNLDEWLGGCGAELEDVGLEQFHPMWSRQFAGPNWKICKDGFIENYHFAALHARSLPTLIGNVNVTDIWGLHSRILMPDKAINEQRKLPEENWDPPTAFATVYYLFPNTMIASCWGDWPLITQLFPGRRPDESVCRQTLLSRRPPTEQIKQQAEEFALVYEKITQNEDFVLDFRIQHGIENSAGRSFFLGRNEHALQHFHQSVAKLVAPPQVANS